MMVHIWSLLYFSVATVWVTSVCGLRARLARTCMCLDAFLHFIFGDVVGPSELRSLWNGRFPFTSVAPRSGKCPRQGVFP
jgi:hypothetical protein